MACSQDFIDFVCETLSSLGDVKSRKMMGDYIIYLNGKCVATACDNTLYVKMHPQLAELLKEAEIGKPYPGAKEHYILDEANPLLKSTFSIMG
ncbi:MAG: TfoX/Sxy family protein [Muribaculaceae bacterium]|nr:TfoX/Sxy family protein [Muribaculaceae bacterium]